MKNGFLKGVKDASPIVLGYIPIGFAFGVLAVQQGMTVLDVFIMSLFVYAGSAQFIASAMLSAGAAVSSIIMTTFLVNLRHLLMSASLAPFLKHIKTHKLALISYGITDETFAVSSTSVKQQTVSAKYFAGLHITSQGSWIVSTVLGGILGNLVPDPARWGIDFALSAMFIGLLLMQMKERKEMIVAICAATISLLMAIYTQGNWNVIIAALLAATIGVGVEQWNEKSF